MQISAPCQASVGRASRQGGAEIRRGVEIRQRRAENSHINLPLENESKHRENNESTDKNRGTYTLVGLKSFWS